MRRPLGQTGDDPSDGQADLNLSLQQPQRVVALPRHNRRNPRQILPQGKSLTIPPPFLWATNHRATVHNLKYLTEKGINLISGDVQCKRCNRQYQIEHAVKAKFFEISRYVKENKYKLNDRAPSSWLNPVLPSCRYCNQENCVKPIMAKNKKSINCDAQERRNTDMDQRTHGGRGRGRSSSHVTFKL
ncbi:hypothetical protein L1987_84809 [Smallanthus sonchifolius]|uniref:Uncharacterized protein n=1 Tax=Smallanthus sonchifolius TaxID=185202 RepID=A0ACB8XVE3_9ASTR|nr:hypothetical protein L1987_84809 [Smallanthus sonchifolius]